MSLSEDLRGAEGRLGIWRYVDEYSVHVDPQFRLFLGEGSTPCLSLAGERWGGIAVKREDLNPTGSHKDRALAFQVSRLREQGHQTAVISSSGNAAVAAAAYCGKAGIRLIAFVSPETAPGKLSALEQLKAVIVACDKPISSAKELSARHGWPNLRPSLSDDSVEGFKSIGFEIAEQTPESEAVFTFATSGSSAIGIGEALCSRASAARRPAPQLHVVHVGSLGAIADGAPNSRLCGGLTGGVTRRARAVRSLVDGTGGAVWTVSDEEIIDADESLRSQGIVTSFEGCASLAAAQRARSKGMFTRAVVVLTGRRYEALEAPMIARPRTCEVEDLERYLVGVDRGRHE